MAKYRGLYQYQPDVAKKGASSSKFGGNDFKSIGYSVNSKYQTAEVDAHRKQTKRGTPPLSNTKA